MIIFPSLPQFLSNHKVCKLFFSTLPAGSRFTLTFLKRLVHKIPDSPQLLSRCAETIRNRGVSISPASSLSFSIRGLFQRLGNLSAGNFEEFAAFSKTTQFLKSFHLFFNSKILTLSFSLYNHIVCLASLPFLAPIYLCPLCLQIHSALSRPLPPIPGVSSGSTCQLSHLKPSLSGRVETVSFN